MNKIRSISIALVVGLLTCAPVWTVNAAPVGPTPGYHGPRPPFCVTTTWRSQHWGLPKTRIGEVCVATPDMWAPPIIYKRLGSWVGADGKTYLIVQRVPMPKHKH